MFSSEGMFTQRCSKFVLLMLVLALGYLVSDKFVSNRIPLVVFAASSLTDVLPLLEEKFEEYRPDIDVRLVFSGSQILRYQIEQGAQAHLFISAHPDHVENLIQAGLASQPKVIARNKLVLAVSQKCLDTLPYTLVDDSIFKVLSGAKKIVVGDESVPLGIYTNAMLWKLEKKYGKSFVQQVESSVVSRESNSRLVLSKILLGEADAAIVYQSDILDRDVWSIPIPDDLQLPVYYSMVIGSEKLNDNTQAFYDFLKGPLAGGTFMIHGLLNPKTDE
ncbi:MAG: molybdate ABC transporter substrate-binding protein [Planctomycetia bacterium]|mgnify:FL=1|nr:molybdate ABC transporter substrate-binding protein [Planctomycetia bacterium]NCF99669.1 molybdate ABC transporter substrate-binding protein [Planctomycetia bacterium]NCG12074.1 molybdate ABC transporter substrate-binding protein [Planctomycetia bacterium]